MTLKKLLPVISLLLCLSACDKIKQTAFFQDEVPVIECNGEFLYKSDIEKILPEGLSTEDSTLYVDNYVKKWAIRNLMYEKASQNIDNIEEIERLVEDYRKSLIIYQYQQELIGQKMSEPSEKDIQNYYDENSEMFRLEEPLIMGLYVKLSKNAPKLNDLRSWLSNPNSENIEKIEKYSYQYAASYQYFADEWVLFDELVKKIPLDEKQKADKNLLQKKLTEAEDEEFIYFLRINEFKETGSVAPIEFTKEKIRVILSNIHKTSYINNFENDLYNSALKKGAIQVFSSK